MTYELRLMVGKNTYNLYGLYTKLQTAVRHADAIGASLVPDGTARILVYDVSGRTSVRVPAEGERKAKEGK